MREKRTRKKIYGIRNKFLVNVLALFTLSTVLICCGVSVIVSSGMREALTDNYKARCGNKIVRMQKLFETTDEHMKNIILTEEMQKSLVTREMQKVEMTSLDNTLLYTKPQYCSDYIYVDNKENIYTKPYQTITRTMWRQSGLGACLKGSYSETRWFYAADDLFGQGKALFVGRYVRNMDFYHEPGILLYKMEPDIFVDVFSKEDKERDIFQGVADAAGEICYFAQGEDDRLSEEIQRELTGNGTVTNGEREGVCQVSMEKGILLYEREENTGFWLFTYIPNELLNRTLSQILCIMALVYLAVLAVSVLAIFFLSRRLTEPIREISEVMGAFDGSDYSRCLNVQTNTELDVIGQRYNKMLHAMESLVEEVKKQERELGESEMRSLVNQINPHFLYNTLDTIYMLARMNHEETTMKMIQSLSRLLKISLSKGADRITLEEELEHVKSYMDILQIRNGDLFEYRIDNEVSQNGQKVIKLILQPIVENSIKHGFADMFEGGFIHIRACEEEDYLVLQVSDNGCGMDRQVREKINRWKEYSLDEIKCLFGDKKSGYGTGNILSRLKITYHDRAQLFFEEVEQGTLCTIKLPRDTREDDRQEEGGNADE